MVQTGVGSAVGGRDYKWQDTVAKVKARLDETGIPYEAGDPPDNRDLLLPDLSTLQPHQLHQLLSKYASWVAYVETQLAFVDSTYTAIWNGIDIAANKLVGEEQMKVDTRKETKDAIRARVILSVPALRDAQMELLDYEALKISLTHLLAAFDRQYWAVSRVMGYRNESAERNGGGG